MERIREKYFPKENGWYIGLKETSETFVFYLKMEDYLNDRYKISIPQEFSNNPNSEFYIIASSWKITQVINGEPTEWSTLREIISLQDSISNNAELEMAYRESLVRKEIKISDKVYKITSFSQHIHSWTVYNIECIETKKMSQICLCGYDEWISESDVELL